MTNLYTPISYSLATQELKDSICNGCGAKGIGGWLIPNTLYGLSVTPACNRHDWMYNSGTTISHKDEADRTFLNNMLRTISASSSSIPGLNWLRKRRAYNYYLAVKHFGGPSYWANKNLSEEMPVVFLDGSS